MPLRSYLSFLLIRLPPISSLFPYTTLFRSKCSPVQEAAWCSKNSWKAKKFRFLCFQMASASRRLSPRRITSVSATATPRSEEHTSELQSQFHLVCRLLLEKKKKETDQ